VGPRAVQNAVVKRKIPSPRWESNPRIPIVQPIAQQLYQLSYHGSSNDAFILSVIFSQALLMSPLSSIF
jgi:hypothetical protein